MNEDEIFTLEDENGETVDYALARYVMSEGREYALLAPVGDTLTRENGIVLEVRRKSGEEEELEQVDDAAGELILAVALESIELSKE